MLTIEDVRQALGENASRYTDDELREMAQDADRLAEVVLELARAAPPATSPKVAETDNHPH